RVARAVGLALEKILALEVPDRLARRVELKERVVDLAGEAVALLGGAPVSYGKAAIVGLAGAMEHGGAMIHPRLGKPMRAAVGGGAALIPSNAKVAAAGTPIDLPLGHKDEAWSFDHFDTMTVMVADAPRPDEIVRFFDTGVP
ncbi:MAG: amino acid synthesis family protein, partial [Pseudomonadota bacterium]